jgi:hypothetical protein
MISLHNFRSFVDRVEKEGTVRLASTPRKTLRPWKLFMECGPGALLASSRKKGDSMQEKQMEQRVDTARADMGMEEYLNAAVMQTEYLRKILDGLQKGTDLSLAAWSGAFDASHRTLEHINKAVTLAQEVFEGHMVQMSGAMSEELICNEFACLTWK